MSPGGVVGPCEGAAPLRGSGAAGRPIVVGRGAFAGADVGVRVAVPGEGCVAGIGVGAFAVSLATGVPAWARSVAGKAGAPFDAAPFGAGCALAAGTRSATLVFCGGGETKTEAVGASCALDAGACDREPTQMPAPPTASAPKPSRMNIGAREVEPPGVVLPHDACVLPCFDPGGGTVPCGNWKSVDEMPAA